MCRNVSFPSGSGSSPWRPLSHPHSGRDIKNPFGRIAGGLVSLYGIMGSYGISAFVGDTLSYCRLLALGLTTSIVAMSFNLLGGMVKEIPYVGLILFVLILITGHLFNLRSAYSVRLYTP